MTQFHPSDRNRWQIASTSCAISDTRYSTLPYIHRTPGEIWYGHSFPRRHNGERRQGTIGDYDSRIKQQFGSDSINNRWLSPVNPCNLSRSLRNPPSTLLSIVRHFPRALSSIPSLSLPPLNMIKAIKSISRDVMACARPLRRDIRAGRHFPAARTQRINHGIPRSIPQLSPFSGWPGFPLLRHRVSTHSSSNSNIADSARFDRLNRLVSHVVPTFYYSMAFSSPFYRSRDSYLTQSEAEIRG